MIRNYKKQIFIALALIFILFCVVFCFVFLIKDDNKQSLNSKDRLSVNFIDDKDSIIIDNILTVPDVVGKTLDGDGTKEGTQGYLEFTIKSNSNKKVNYTIIADDNNNSKDNRIDDKFIKLYLTDFSDKAYEGFEKNDVLTFFDLVVESNSPSDKILYQGTISAKEEQNFRLRVWLSNSYVLNNDKESFTFKIDVKND